MQRGPQLPEMNASGHRIRGLKSCLHCAVSCTLILPFSTFPAFRLLAHQILNEPKDQTGIVPAT